MFKINSTCAIDWRPDFDFALRKGDNVLTSRQAVPAELWTKLKRFRGLGIVAFEGEAEAGKDVVKLDELNEQQLFAMSKEELAELAAASSVTVDAGAKKAALIEALKAKLPKPPEQPAEDSTQADAAKKRGGRRPADPPVSSGTNVAS